MKYYLLFLTPLFCSCSNIDSSVFCLDQEGFPSSITGLWGQSTSTNIEFEEKRLYISCKSVAVYRYEQFGSFPKNEECAGIYTKDGSKMLIEGNCASDTSYSERKDWKTSFKLISHSKKSLVIEHNGETIEYKRL